MIDLLSFFLGALSAFAFGDYRLDKPFRAFLLLP